MRDEPCAGERAVNPSDLRLMLSGSRPTVKRRSDDDVTHAKINVSVSDQPAVAAVGGSGWLGGFLG
jgi:hypothetical protein